MPSKILYDIKTLKIFACQPKPHGVSLPSFNALCRSARIPEDQKQFMAEIRIDEDMLTREAKKQLKLVDSDNGIQAIKKSKQELSESQKSDIEKKTHLRKKRQLMEEFVLASLENDEKKVNQCKIRYKQLFNGVKKE